MSTDRTELAFRGAFLLSGTRHEDARGDFRMVFALDALPYHDPERSYLASAFNRRSGTIRGLHHQAAPHEEMKTVWCATGAIYDVLVDLRPDEATYGQWISVHLMADDSTALHVPKGVAHGYQTLEDDTTVSYLIDGSHEPASARTISWKDPGLAIEWPLPVSAISVGDEAAPTWTEQR